MINTTAFGKRIQEIMKFYHVSASGFADAMGVGRSSISHILSGRNKPSLDFVMKITDAYPEAELYWLLYGKGTFPKSEQEIPIVESTETEPPIVTATTPTLTEETETSAQEQDLFSQPNSTISTDSRDNILSETQQHRKPSTLSNNKDIQQIVFFYKDGSFDIYKN